ncbi:hypothetical protein MKW98_021055 [Papaver atlanticum]|uniref:HECT-type E3 ubiquitin transferase n=1 Tax=Papaver atlanticum TaxID=357466 RepID=A0AAD4T9V5_9MAGN|nr:hypothetical protein MKW98_021055 [Papaver atlanticum]
MLCCINREVVECLKHPGKFACLGGKLLKDTENMLLEPISISWECFCRENRQPALQVLDIVLHELPTFRYAPVGRSFYFPNLWAEVTDYELIPDIDLDDMRVNTEYSGYSSASPIIQWFWEVAQAFSKEDKARLLQFVTGTSKVPLEGFSALQGISDSQRFQIHKAYGSPNHLPSAHTCFNQLDLPEYPSKQHL